MQEIPQQPMVVPYKALAKETLRSLVEEFVSREGTDYGFEVAFDDKVEQILRSLKSGEIGVVFDPNLDSCNIVDRSVLEQLSE